MDIGGDTGRAEMAHDGIAVAAEKGGQLNHIEVIGTAPSVIGSHRGRHVLNFSQPLVIRVGQGVAVGEVFGIPFQGHPSHGRLYVGHVALVAGAGNIVSPPSCARRLEFGGSVFGLAMQTERLQGALYLFGME